MLRVCKYVGRVCFLDTLFLLRVDHVQMYCHGVPLSSERLSLSHLPSPPNCRRWSASTLSVFLSSDSAVSSSTTPSAGFGAPRQPVAFPDLPNPSHDDFIPPAAHSGRGTVVQSDSDRTSVFPGQQMAPHHHPVITSLSNGAQSAPHPDSDLNGAKLAERYAVNGADLASTLSLESRFDSTQPPSLATLFSPADEEGSVTVLMSGYANEDGSAAGRDDLPTADLDEDSVIRAVAPHASPNARSIEEVTPRATLSLNLSAAVSSRPRRSHRHQPEEDDRAEQHPTRREPGEAASSCKRHESRQAHPERRQQLTNHKVPEEQPHLHHQQQYEPPSQQPFCSPQQQHQQHGSVIVDARPPPPYEFSPVANAGSPFLGDVTTPGYDRHDFSPAATTGSPFPRDVRDVATPGGHDFSPAADTCSPFPRDGATPGGHDFSPAAGTGSPFPRDGATPGYDRLQAPPTAPAPLKAELASPTCINTPTTPSAPQSFSPSNGLMYPLSWSRQGDVSLAPPLSSLQQQPPVFGLSAFHPTNGFSSSSDLFRPSNGFTTHSAFSQPGSMTPTNSNFFRHGNGFLMPPASSQRSSRLSQPTHHTPAIDPHLLVGVEVTLRSNSHDVAFYGKKGVVQSVTTSGDATLLIYGQQGLFRIPQSSLLLIRPNIGDFVRVLSGEENPGAIGQLVSLSGDTATVQFMTPPYESHIHPSYIGKYANSMHATGMQSHTNSSHLLPPQYQQQASLQSGPCYGHLSASYFGGPTANGYAQQASPAMPQNPLTDLFLNATSRTQHHSLSSRGPSATAVRNGLRSRQRSNASMRAGLPLSNSQNKLDLLKAQKLAFMKFLSRAHDDVKRNEEPKSTKEVVEEVLGRSSAAFDFSKTGLCVGPRLVFLGGVVVV